jgi:hypothetical protein
MFEDDMVCNEYNDREGGEDKGEDYEDLNGALEIRGCLGLLEGDIGPSVKFIIGIKARVDVGEERS